MRLDESATDACHSADSYNLVRWHAVGRGRDGAAADCPAALLCTCTSACKPLRATQPPPQKYYGRPRTKFVLSCAAVTCNLRLPSTHLTRKPCSVGDCIMPVSQLPGLLEGSWSMSGAVFAEQNEARR